MSGVELAIHTDSVVPIDECLVIVVTLEAGNEPARVSARLNLIEGDLVIAVGGAAGYTARCTWPWPVDSMPRWVDLEPGRRVAGAVPLLSTDTSAPLFPSSGAYTLTATFDAGPGMELSSAPVVVRRTKPDDDGTRAAALRDRDVLQSLLSASVLGAAADGLAALASSGTVTTRALSALALDRIDEVVASVEPDDDGSVAELVRAVSAVLPSGFADADPRRAALDPVLVGRGEERALFSGTPY